MSEDEHGRVSSEVIELGQTLFDTLIEAASVSSMPRVEGEPFPLDEVRATAEQFFAVLQILLSTPSKALVSPIDD